MSIPILSCRYLKASTDMDEFENLAQDLAVNLHQYGHWSVYPCPHSPMCEPLSKEEAQQLQTQLKNRIEEIQKEKKYELMDIPGEPG